MDPVFDAQYLPMKNLFSREGTEIEVAYTPDGEVDYIYVVDQLLTVDRDDNIERLQRTLRGLRVVHRDELGERPVSGDLVVLSIDALEEEGRLTVPEALDLLDERLGDDNPALHGGPPLAAAVYVMHTSKLCAASEPAVPCGSPPQPCPPPNRAEESRYRVRLGVCDTGLLLDLNLDWCPWLIGVEGEEDPLGRVLPGGLRSIPYDAGHGTFVAGVARCMAPEATVYVGNHFTKSGGELEYVIVAKLEELIATQSPHLVNLSAGTYTRNNWPLLSFSDFLRRHGDIPLVAAAGNDSTNREFWPAAFPGTVAVGALGADWQNLAYFSNYGPWVDVYAPGEGLVNAFATGVYTYQEPPKRPTRQIFEGMAQWDGTSFSAPEVTGLIAAEMSRTGADAQTAMQAVLALAQSQAISGVGPALFPPDAE